MKRDLSGVTITSETIKNYSLGRALYDLYNSESGAIIIALSNVITHWHNKNIRALSILDNIEKSFGEDENQTFEIEIKLIHDIFDKILLKIEKKEKEARRKYDYYMLTGEEEE